MLITIIGEVCQDIFRYGKVTRINPEAPSPIFIPTWSNQNHGMAANVKYNLISMFLKQQSNAHELLQITPLLSSITKERYVEEQHNHILLRIDSNDQVHPIIFTEDMGSKIEKSDYVLVSDYNKGFLDCKALKYISQHDSVSFLDTKKPLGYWAKDYTWIKINSTEFANPAHDQGFLEEYKDKIIVTLGKNGARIGDKTYTPEHQIDIVDVSGAGDTFLAAFAFGIINNADTDRAIKFANFMAGKAVSIKGVVNVIAHRIPSNEYMAAYYSLMNYKK